MHDAILRRGKILMVDDDISSLCLLENVLNRLGFPCLRKIQDPTRAIAECNDWQPDLIITDLDMPDLDGLELVAKIRAEETKDSCLPILVLTGSSDARAKRDALVAGASDILFKPFDPSEMQMRVRNLLQTRFQHLEIQNQNRVLEQRVGERTAELNNALGELKQSQRQVVQQERFRAFGEMAGGVVHDFNNALMSIIGYSTLLLQESTLLDDRELLLEYLKTMNTAGRDAAHVVSRLRDFYRPREMTDIFAAMNVNELLEEVVPMTRPKWRDKALETGRTIRLDLELQKVPLVLGNAAELREVITNLIFNAVDAMPEGGVITLRSEMVGETVKIEIADSGIGMSEEVRLRCLEPFFSTKGEQGTGLGLSMAFGIIRRHEGTLDIETTPGSGTTFRLTLPCHHEGVNDVSEVRLTLDRTLSVLVVDDDPTSREVVSQYLRADGHRVITANNGGEAMQHIAGERFDVMITDHGMPGMNGFQLADAVRRTGAAQSVILLTGFALAPEQQPKSIDCMLRKPLVPDELRHALHRSLAPVLTS